MMSINDVIVEIDAALERYTRARKLIAALESPPAPTTPSVRKDRHSRLDNAEGYSPIAEPDGLLVEHGVPAAPSEAEDSSSRPNLAVSPVV